MQPQSVPPAAVVFTDVHGLVSRFANGSRLRQCICQLTLANLRTTMISKIRAAVSDDRPFLWQMLYYAAHMDESGESLESARANPDLLPYVDDFGRPGDLGVIAIDSLSDTNIGAAWIRSMPANWPLYKFVDPGTPEPLPWAAALLKQRAENNSKDAPGAHCLPRGITNAGALFPFRLVQTAGLLVMLFEDDIPSHRQVFLDGRSHPKDMDPKWMGHSVGHWEGDTLVIDTVGFDDRSWLTAQGHPHTEKMHVIERFRRPDLGHLETEITVDDPAVSAKPYTMKRVSDLAPTEDIYEFICPENNRDVEHLVGK